MATNPYFAYSLKSEYSGDTSSSSGSGSPIEISTTGPPKKNLSSKKRTTSRACDVCSIRKTKCDNARPCRSCVANNVKCTELRVRKKSGPKTFRQKTLDSINSVGGAGSGTFTGISADLGLVASLDSGNMYPSLLPVIQVLGSMPQNMLAECVPFTVPEIGAEAISLIEALKSCPPVAGGTVQENVTRYAISTLCLVLLEMLSLVNKPDNYDAMLRDLQVHILSIRSACERLVIFGSGDHENSLFDTHYYLALAELHQFSYLVIKAAPDNYKLVHLRAAIVHCDLLEPSSQENMYSKAELRRTLQLWERHMLLFGPDPVFRRVGVNASMEVKPSVDIMTKNPFLNSYCDLLHVTDFLSDSGLRMPEPLTWSYCPGTSGDSALTYTALKSNLDTIAASGYLLNQSREHTHVQLLGLAIRFKVLLVSANKLEHSFVAEEIMAVIVRFNTVLEIGQQFKLFMEKYNFAIVLLEVLAAYLAVVPEHEFTPEALNALVHFTTTLSAYISERSRRYLDDPQVSGWFARFYGK